MSEEVKIKEDEQIITLDMVKEMINDDFLNLVKKYAIIGKQAKMGDQKIDSYQVQLTLRFDDSDKDLNFDDLMGYHFSFQPQVAEETQPCEPCETC